MPLTSLYLKERFYANLAIKYLMESFYATAIGVKCNMNSPLGDIHKGNILRQSVKRCLNMVLVIRRYQYYITVLFIYPPKLCISLYDYAMLYDMQ